MLRRRRARRIAIRALAAASALALCACHGRGGAVRTPMRAIEVAQSELRSAGLYEDAVSADRQGGAWIVVTRSQKIAGRGHLVTVDAATGKAKVERWRTVELGAPR